MDKKEFVTIVEKIYKNSREFWEGDFPEKLDLEIKLIGDRKIDG